MFISPTETVKLYNVSKPTLYKDMSEGKITFTKDNRDRRKLNVAELDRLYEKRKNSRMELTSAIVHPTKDLTELNVNNQHLAEEIMSIREQIEQGKNREIELLEQQIEQFRNQVENLNQHLEETREEHRVYVRLLEDKREEQGAQTTQWDQKLRTMETQLQDLQQQNRLLITREEERKKRIEEIRRKREAEKRQEKDKKNGLINWLLSKAGQGG